MAARLLASRRRAAGSRTVTHAVTAGVELDPAPACAWSTPSCTERLRPDAQDRRQMIGQQAPALAIVERAVQLAAAGAEIQARLLHLVRAEGVAQHGEVAAFLR